MAPAGVAVRRALRPLVETMTEELGLFDEHAEHLHDGRVALRAIRALWSMLGEQLASPRYRWIRDRMREAQQVTGPLRDLDVHLERPELPAELERVLRSHRDAEVVRVRDWLASGRWRKLRKHLRAEVEREGGGALPVALVVRGALFSAYGELMADGAQITPTAPAEAYHSLRKRVKRVRYLLEVFGSVLPADDAPAVVADLKGLQTSLGRFQDAAVRASWLAATPDVPDVVRDVAISEAVRAEEACRDEFPGVFGALSAPAARNRMRRVIGMLTGS
jgi:CHAD domain-containing protein